MDYSPIPKPPIDRIKVKPNLTESSLLGKDFDWQSIETELGIKHNSDFNLGYLATDRHAASNRKDKLALLWVGKDGEEERYTFSQLKSLTDKFANVLAGLGIAKGDRVFMFMELIPEL